MALFTLFTVLGLLRLWGDELISVVVWLLNYKARNCFVVFWRCLVMCSSCLILSEVFFCSLFFSRAAFLTSAFNFLVTSSSFLDFPSQDSILIIMSVKTSSFNHKNQIFHVLLLCKGFPYKRVCDNSDNSDNILFLRLTSLQ